MHVRRETDEHIFAMLKVRMGATHPLMKTLPKVATEMVQHLLAYNLTRVKDIVGVKPLPAAIQAFPRSSSNRRSSQLPLRSPQCWRGLLTVSLLRWGRDATSG
jgi:hypothetical protein